MTALRTRESDEASHLGFREFVASRPDEEKWELVEGRFIMQAQPSLDHPIIAGNLDRLLNDALERLGLPWIAIQNPAIDLSPAIEGHVYVPDVAVIDGNEVEPGRNMARTCYLAAEIVSASDRRKPAGTTRSKIAIKADGYETLPACEAILLIEQARFDIVVATRIPEGWAREQLTSPDAVVRLPAFGFTCRLADLYARTSLTRVHSHA